MARVEVEKVEDWRWNMKMEDGRLEIGSMNTDTKPSVSISSHLSWKMEDVRGCYGEERSRRLYRDNDDSPYATPNSPCPHSQPEPPPPPHAPRPVSPRPTPRPESPHSVSHKPKPPSDLLSYQQVLQGPGWGTGSA